MNVERETLVAALREQGIRFLAPSDAQPDEPITSQTLIGQLASSEDARLRVSLVPLFILHPPLAQWVAAALHKLDESAQRELMAAYMAAVYLQRMWSVRLGFYLPHVAWLPDLFSVQMGLPSPDERYGKAGLHALADWRAARSPYPFNWLASWQHVMDLLFEQLKQEHKIEHAPAG